MYSANYITAFEPGNVEKVRDEGFTDFKAVVNKDGLKYTLSQEGHISRFSVSAVHLAGREDKIIDISYDDRHKVPESLSEYFNNLKTHTYYTLGKWPIERQDSLFNNMATRAGQSLQKK